MVGGPGVPRGGRSPRRESVVMKHFITAATPANLPGQPEATRVSNRTGEQREEVTTKPPLSHGFVSVSQPESVGVVSEGAGDRTQDQRIKSPLPTSPNAQESKGKATTADSVCTQFAQPAQNS